MLYKHHNDGILIYFHKHLKSLISTREITSYRVKQTYVILNKNTILVNDEVSKELNVSYNKNDVIRGRGFTYKCNCNVNGKHLTYEE